MIYLIIAIVWLALLLLVLLFLHGAAILEERAEERE